MKKFFLFKEPELFKHSGEFQKEYRYNHDSQRSLIVILIALVSLIVSIIGLFL